MGRRSRLGIIEYLGVGIALGLTALVSLSLLWTADYRPIPFALGKDFEASLLEVESELPLKPGTAKTLIWRNEDRSPTNLSLVFLHGFSASKDEIAPVPEVVAETHGMNLFMTRMTGHGLDGEALGRIRAEDLIRDAEEAMSIGRRMGRQVVLMGVSTGASLALMLAQRYPEKVAGLILISPNFRPLRAESLFLKGPVGGWIAENLLGWHSWEAKSDEEQRVWTTRYPARAIHELMNLLSWINRFDLRKMSSPALVLYSNVDDVVSSERIRRKFHHYGGPKRMVEVTGAHHVLAGRIKSPDTTDFVLERIHEFLKFDQQ